MDNMLSGSKHNNSSFRQKVKFTECCHFRWLLAAGILSCAPQTWAGAYIFAGEANGVDLVLHPTGYTGAGGTLPLNVCITPGTPNEAAMEQSVRNIIAVYNQRLPTTGNLRTNFLAAGTLDFESVALHELGHCLGKAHVNAASESGLPHPAINSTKATNGANNIFDTNAGADGVIGSSDDIRGDDVNLHWFRSGNNNPFTIDYQTVDSSTYIRDTAVLPFGDLFATNGDRTVGGILLNTPATEAVMQQGTFAREIQRTVTPDGVATLQYAMSGIDELAGTADDYDIQLNYATSNCDIEISFDIASGSGLAFCSVGGNFIAANHVRIANASMHFNAVDYNWFFNTAAPCTETLALPQDQWKMFSLPCSVGISTGNTVNDILGDDLVGVYDTNWVVYERDAASETYTKLALTDTMHTGRGYWAITSELGQSFDVEGQYNGSPDTLLRGSAAGLQNLVGHPFDFSVDWASVQIIDGIEVKPLLTAVADGDLSETYHVWNGSAYDAFDATTLGMTGTLTKFSGIWTKAFKDDIRLRIPSIVSTALTAITENQSESLVVSDKETEYEITNDGAWHVRIIVESGEHRDAGNVLGQLPDSLDGQDKHDLEELAPIGDSFLTVVFPHEKWEGEDGDKAWGYTSDFHQLTRKPQGEWTFAVHSSSEIRQATLRLEGSASILRKGTLIDLETGKKVKFYRGAYSFTTNTDKVRYFSFRI